MKEAQTTDTLAVIDRVVTAEAQQPYLECLEAAAPDNLSKGRRYAIILLILICNLIQVHDIHLASAPSNHR